MYTLYLPENNKILPFNCEDFSCLPSGVLVQMPACFSFPYFKVKKIELNNSSHFWHKSQQTVNNLFGSKMPKQRFSLKSWAYIIS